MNPIVLVLTLILMVCSVALIAIILFQSGRTAGASAITGGAGNFLSKNKAQTKDLLLKRLTVIVSIVFIVAIVIVGIIETI
ncbi:MAG: preprotein translocase subunit SecG [Ruminococcaceae bacterium]|nr:preprotein translocase subunit SecG [Oscillospiraceae bacterium]MBQ2916455.1 preprotein translocase subunit SecG [Clostridia bacterium]